MHFSFFAILLRSAWILPAAVAGVSGFRSHLYTGADSYTEISLQPRGKHSTWPTSRFSSRNAISQLYPRRVSFAQILPRAQESPHLARRVVIPDEEDLQMSMRNLHKETAEVKESNDGNREAMLTGKVRLQQHVPTFRSAIQRMIDEHGKDMPRVRRKKQRADDRIALLRKSSRTAEADIYENVVRVWFEEWVRGDKMMKELVEKRDKQVERLNKAGRPAKSQRGGQGGGDGKAGSGTGASAASGESKQTARQRKEGGEGRSGRSGRHYKGGKGST